MLNPRVVAVVDADDGAYEAREAYLLRLCADIDDDELDFDFFDDEYEIEDDRD